MELAPGVFVSTVSADTWEPDPDVPGTEMHELVHVLGFSDKFPPWAARTQAAGGFARGELRPFRVSLMRGRDDR